MSRCPGCGWWHEPGRLADELERIDASPWTAAELDDATAIAIAGWADGRSVILTAEVKARRDLHQDLADRFAAVERRPDE